MSAWEQLAAAARADIRSAERCVAVGIQPSPYQLYRRLQQVTQAMEALLTDEAVERAARTITPELYYHYDEWDDANEEDRARALKMARTALTAALDASE